MDYYCCNNILNILGLDDQINYLSTCRIFYNNLTIEKLSAIKPKQKRNYISIKKLSAEKLKQNDMTNYIFRNVATIDASNNDNITDASFMKKLKILIASRDCGIDQNG
jgi:hypothetical protein